MRIAIIGAGGVGGYFGAKLVKAGYDVKFLARGKQLEAISTHGLQVKSILGDFEVKPVTATDKISELGPSELILLAIKAWQIKEVRDHLSEIVDTNTVILPLQNGVLVAEELEKSVNKKRVLGGVCRIISKIEAPGVINHFGATPSIVFGSFDPMKSDELQKIKSAFDQAEIHSSISENINLEIWKKFAFICV